MSNLRIKIIGIIIMGIAIFLLFQNRLFPNQAETKSTPTATTQATQQNNPPTIVSTKPDPLEDNIVSGSDVVEITFNRPLENVGEFKSRIEPKIDYKVELSGDRKTAKIIPAKPYPLGTTFTLFIGTETKFDGVGRWGQEKVFHFRTIKYTGV